jgi:hypothetical protein
MREELAAGVEQEEQAQELAQTLAQEQVGAAQLVLSRFRLKVSVAGVRVPFMFVA